MDKIICLGKNYPAHAAELGESQPEQPVIFLKPPSALWRFESGSPPPLPSGEVHHELEIVFEIAPDLESFSRVTLGLDLTRRDLQSKLKKSGHPWEIAKVFLGSAWLAPWRPIAEWPTLQHAPFRLEVNGELRQQARGTDMLFAPERALRLVRSYLPLVAGDLLFTGTPVGVAALNSGDHLRLTWTTNPGVDVQAHLPAGRAN